MTSPAPKSKLQRINFLFFVQTQLKKSNSRLDPGRREKNKLNIYFQTSLRCLKRFYEGLLKSFIKPFEASQRKVKIKIQVTFYLNATF